MADRRVAITGIGAVTPLGIGAGDFWAALLAGRRAAKPIDLFDASGFTCTIGAQLDDFSARNYVPKHYRKAVKVMARDIEIAVAAADGAFRDSGLVTRGIDPDNVTIDPARTGANIGAGLICSDLDELGVAVSSATRDGKFDLKLWGQAGMNNLTPLWLLKYLPNMLACHVTIIHGTEGPSNTITCGDASGILAVGEAARYVQRGTADVVIAGGAESKLNPMGLLRQGLMGRLCTDGGSPAEACRPFDPASGGSLIGEGGGLVILEDLDHAVQRGARIYAEVVGFAGACDPGGIEITTPTAGRMDLAVAKAVADAGIAADDIDLIVANGTGVPAEDACEVAAWRQALGERASTAAAVALTGAMGSLAAGAGAMQLATAAMALAGQVVPPTANFTPAAAAAQLNLSQDTRPQAMQYAVVGGFTIGGQSAACVLKRYSQ